MTVDSQTSEKEVGCEKKKSKLELLDFVVMFARISLTSAEC